jgi:hypothetical protein
VITEKGQQGARAQETGLEAALAALDGEPKRNIIRTLVGAGVPLPREELAEKLGLHPNGGSYGANLGWLRTMGLITERGADRRHAGGTRVTVNALVLLCQ